MKAFTTLVVLAAAVVGHCHGWSLNAWASTNYAGRQFSTSTSGTHLLGFTAKSYKWSSIRGDGCCIKFCNGSNEVGNWCQSKSNSNVASPGFNKVVVGCGSTVLNC
ncbi:hypothetical protein BGW38_009442 [Lunasporangiospora selenospora]|uniref:Uncharacterized protein n=1 Tax=Lunasporangiospora selenospora TaxID=979761 RepID=A0A9P6FXY0_9FUNG|nr:hypothetical protein BGW38_009442 [Lunasporangiospora selenospora]